MTAPDLFDQIRAGAAAVMMSARHVRIIDERIDAYVSSLPFDTLAAPSLDPDSHFIGSPADTLAFFVTLDAINFGSGYFPHLKKLPGKSGYFTVATHLTHHFRTHDVMTAHALAAMNTQRCREIFQQTRDDGPVDELMSLFAKALADLGSLLLDRYGGNFETVVASADHSAARLVEILAQMPLFRDVQKYGDLHVPFYKRAQLTAADLHLALTGNELGRFDDLHRLTIFADNLVPHVLRCDGVLVYSDALASQIDAGALIPANSEQEIEIRAAAIDASERIIRQLRQKGREFTSMQLDYLLWNRGQQPVYKARPRHRARGVFY